MKQVSSEFKRDIYKASRDIDVKVTIGSFVYGTSAVKSFSVENSIQSSDGYSIGETIASSLDLELRTANLILQTDPIKVELGLLVTKVIEGVETQVWEWVTLGKYYVEEMKVTGGGLNRSIKASDGMIKTEELLVGQVTQTTTLSGLATLVTNTSGLTWVDTIPSTTITPLTEIPTVREAIGYIASCMGGNAVITPNGSSIKVLIPGTTSRASLTGSNYFSFYADDYNSVIGRIDCEVNNDLTLTATSGTGSTILEIKNPIMTQALLNTVVTIADDVMLRGFDLSAQGDFSLEPGDLITVSDIYDGLWGLTITTIRFSYSGGITMALSAKGLSNNINAYGQQGGTLSKEIETLKETSVQETDVVEYDSTMTQTSFSSEGTTVGDSLVSLNTLIVNTMTTGYVGTVDLQAYLLQAEKAFITDALITSLSASKINTGVLNANLVKIQSEDGQMTFYRNVLQVKDSNDTVRVQIGKDNNNNYGVYVCDANGNLIFDSTNGLRAQGIKSPIIVDQMISEDANIDGAKIDIQSLITEINDNGQTETIKASKVLLDTSQQTLEIGFSEVSTTANNAATTAGNAQTTATNAATAASSAQSTANSAATAASNAQSTADSKSKTFTSQPSPPYSIGDIYKNGNAVYICTTARSSGNYNSSDWTLTADKTSENTANNTTNVGQMTSNDVNYKLTAQGLTLAVSEAISDGTNAITGKSSTTVKFIMDINGLTIKNGGFKIRNAADTQDMFYVDTNGNLTMAGILQATSISTNSGKFSVSSGGVMTCTDANINGTITLQGTQSMTIENASNTRVGSIYYFDNSSTESWAVGCLNIAGADVTRLTTDVQSGSDLRSYTFLGVNGTDLIVLGSNASGDTGITFKNCVTGVSFMNNSPVTFGGVTTFNGNLSITSRVFLTNSYPGIIATTTNGYAIKDMMVGSSDWSYIHVDFCGISTAYGISIWQSDRTLKNGISDTEIDAYSIVKRMKHRQFDWKDENKGHTVIGYVAQELESLEPQMVFQVGDLLQPKESTIIPIISKALQDSILKIEALEERIQELENR